MRPTELGPDLNTIAGWMTQSGIGRGDVEGVTVLAGGTQNLVVRFSLGGRPFVLRCASPISDGGNETIRREAHILAALADTAVPHPRLVASGDPGLLGYDFYLMEAIEGFNAVTKMPALHAGRADIRHAMGLSIVDSLAEIGNVDYQACGLADLGRPEGFLARQVPRWLSQLHSYHGFAGWPGPAQLGAVQRVADWLETNVPSDFCPGIMHGDFHIANVMFANDGPEVAAIIDWELCTIGDPRLDLGWLIATWPHEHLPSLEAVRLQPSDGFPKGEVLVARYAERTTRDMSSFGWFAVLACFKLGILLEQTFARSLAGKASEATGKMLHQDACKLFDRAAQWIESGKWN